MKYLISIFVIVLFFTACQKKEVVVFYANKVVVEEKKTEIKKEIIVPDKNITKEVSAIEDIIIEINEEENNNSEDEVIITSDTIALMYSSKVIGKYSIKVSNIASIYASTNENLSLKFIDIDDESNESIKFAFDELRDNNISKVLFYITQDNINNLYQYKNLGYFDLYLPLVLKDKNNIYDMNISLNDNTINAAKKLDDINKKTDYKKIKKYIDKSIKSNTYDDEDNISILDEVILIDDTNLSIDDNSTIKLNKRNVNIVYGSINSIMQFEKIKKMASSHIVEVYDNTYRSKKLHEALNDENVTSYILSGKYPNYKRFIKNHKLIKNSSLILNINIVKSSILLSQITANDDLKVSEVLSTQNNFTPTLFALTQNKDIENMIIANSIMHTNDKIENMSNLLGHDILYDWVNYSTILGLEYLKYKKNILFGNIEIINNEVAYPVNLFKAKQNSFRPYLKEGNDTINNENIN